MILQALKEYYDRKAANPEAHMAPGGFEWKEIPYVVTLNKNGEPINIESTWEGEGKARRAKAFLVPQAVKKSFNVAANHFWDNPEYALGVNLKDRTPERILEMHKGFVKRIEDLGDIPDEGLKALKLFNALSDKATVLKDAAAKNPSMQAALTELLETGRNLSFRLAGDACLIVEREVVHNSINTSPSAAGESNSGICLVTGQKAKLSRLHPSIKGVWPPNPMGGNVVSFNLDAFNSYGKEQGANAPIGEPAVFAYTTALNYLLGKDSKQRIQVGDATTVFWAEKPTSLEKDFADFFNLPPKDDPDRGARAVESLLRSVENGAFHADEGKARFYILGLAPNAARLAVRFWINNTVGDVSEKIARHFKDVELVHGPKESGILPIFRLLVSTAAAGKSENIPSNLAGETMRAILEGLPYPRTLLQAAIRRIRAEHDITYPRAALIKASINRFVRYQKQDDKEDLKVSLDTTNINKGYRLGRLFATLEKIQSEASPGINATIRDKFYGAASSTPVTVFGNLMRLKNHHLSKLEHPGRKVFFEKLLTEIMDGIAASGFPTHLTLDDQGRFAIGYYHQTQGFYTKKAE